ncbi:P-loop containing nucleoside triphosphate hydrolase protein [Neoconidiobolus thromboides FSU 785]|nr:P-loop containing nucleoside triphosphate hydrolase protein [Neoconidiobolus thromboides FSU 785]
MASELLKKRQSLPVYPYKEEFCLAIQNADSLVVVGETGSGKTTQIPQFLFEKMNELQSQGDNTANFSIQSICVTQPRRIAAITVAKRVCLETNTTLGDQIGYTIRFEDRCSNKTRLRYLTDGILLREATMDFLLPKYDCIIIDEAHERSLDTDIIIGLIKKAQKARKELALSDPSIKPLKVIIMSATLNVERFSDFFDGCPIFTIPGRSYDIMINHHNNLSIEKLKSSYVERSVETALQIHFDSPPGDILIFLTGQQEIHKAMKQFSETHQEILKEKSEKITNKELEPYLVPIYASLEQIDQKAAFEPSPINTRKIVFATNIAQTSITIPGIVYVIDSGFVKQKTFEPKTGMDALLVVPISKAAAIQRAGRAGRTQNGVVYRLYSRAAFQNLIDETVPEIQRSSLLSTVLAMKSMGIDDIQNFEFLDSPGLNHINSSLKKLTFLGALDLDGIITELGSKMARLPLSPYLSCALIDSCLSDIPCSYQMLVIASMLSTEDVIVKAKTEEGQKVQKDIFYQLFFDQSGDHLTLYNIFVLAARNRFEKEWCYNHYLNHRLLLHASSIMEQLKQVLIDLKFEIVSLSKYDIRSNILPSKQFDASIVLKSLCRGYFLNVAKKHPQGKAFYHYGATSNSKSSHLEVIPSSRMLALHLHPTSSLNSFNTNTKLSRLSHIDWVIYSQIIYTSQCLLRHVSNIDPKWFLPYLEQAKAMNMATSQPNSLPITPKLEHNQLSQLKSPSGSSPYNSDRSPARVAEVEGALSRYLARKKLKKK